MADYTLQSEDVAGIRRAVRTALIYTGKRIIRMMENGVPETNQTLQRLFWEKKELLRLKEKFNA